ncbi:muscleblind-like protein 1 isoform X13 [Babylonia areolata]|uniref:muscleblind-like protein 1 isoform X13 n=1 Tax=Babylonia areolata TaxID=304850 RepID=UPI003FD257D1
MAMVNPINPMLNPNAKDSRWLTLEVCREYQRNKCTRTENECKFAHPPAHVEVQNGRVIACFDSIKGKCQRKDPPCKYLHPPQHLREQLLQNGRNNLILKSLQYQALHQQVLPGIIPMTTPVKSVAPAGGKPVAYPTAVLPGPYVAAATPQSRPAVSHPASFVSFAPSALTARAPHYLSTVPTTAVPQFSPYGIPAVAVQGGAADGTIVTPQVPSVISTPMPAKAPARPDRLEVCREFQRGTCSRQPSDCRYAHPTENVTVDCGDNQPQLGLVPPYKRVAVESSNLGKSGIPVYQPTLPAAYHQAATLMQLQQQPYIPAVTYSGEVMSAAYPNYLQQVTGHPPAVPRF